jgi:hypothetical protein
MEGSGSVASRHSQYPSNEMLNVGMLDQLKVEE